MPRIIDEMATEMAEVLNGAASSILNMFEDDSNRILLRRFRKHYDTLSLEDIVAIRMAIGHEFDENSPCKVCQIVARKEFELQED